MKKFTVLLMFAMASISVMSQSYLGRTIRNVNFLETAGTEAPVIKSLQADSRVLIVLLTLEKDCYNVIEIATGEEGYVIKDFVKVGKQVKSSDKAVLKAMGEIVSVNPELTIINNTDRILKLKLNSEVISVLPKNPKTITLSPGTFRYRASAPGSMPIIGTEELKSNQQYTWEFDFITLFGDEE